jgi:tetratricopeptide (TPR) repeat protein
LKSENRFSKVVKKMDSKIDSVINLNLKARDLSDQGDYNGALQSYTEALNLLTEPEYSNEHEIKAKILNNIGHAQVKIGDFDNALVSFNKSAILYHRLGDLLGVGEQFGNVGSVYRDKGMWDDARVSYDKALSAFTLKDYMPGLADQYSNIGYVCAQEKDFDSALDWFYKAKALYEELKLVERARLVEKNISELSGFHKSSVNQKI